MKSGTAKTLVTALAVWFFCFVATGVLAKPPEKRLFPRLNRAIESVRFVAYTPTDLVVRSGKVQAASRQQIRHDLETLRQNFQGLVMYSCADGLEDVPEIAKELGYRAVILGIWDPLSSQEIANATRLARTYPHLIVGIAVGNETLLAERNNWNTLRTAIRNLRASLPKVAITTSEPFYMYVNNTPSDFIEHQDFLLPNVHPVYEPWFNPANTKQAVEFVLQAMDRLRNQTKKPLLIKETGLPSGPASRGFTPERQTLFWSGLAREIQTDPYLGLVYFEAFDHAWKVENAREEFGFRPEEAFWGLYTENGKPKLAIRDLQRLWRHQTSPQ